MLQHRSKQWSSKLAFKSYSATWQEATLKPTERQFRAIRSCWNPKSSLTWILCRWSSSWKWHGWIQFNTLIVCRQDVHWLGLSRPLCGRKNVKIPLRSKTYENPTAPIEQLSSEMVLSYIAHYTTWCQMMSQNTKHTEATAKDWNRVLWLVVGVVWFSHPLGVSCLIRFWLLYAQVSMNIVKFITSTWTPKAPESPLKSPPGPKSLTRKRCAYAPCPPPHPGHKNKDCQVRPSPSIKPSNHATSEIS